ncbi:MAG: hypothetical protein KKG00_14310 [Bacteroidetes bacterium]|nr:hypothetical protein [Bacteroidota bacterium]
MKKALKSTILLSAYVCMALLFNCSKKDTSPSPQNCANNATKVSEAASTYASNQTKANCEAYKNSLRDFFRSCSTFYPAAQKQALDEFLAEPCP